MVKPIGIAAIAVALLSGCSAMGVGKSEFTCTKERTGMPCSSVDEVYQRSNGPNWKAATAVKEKDVPSADPARVASVTPMTPPGWPTPVLEPAQVLRVWVAPWVDDQQSLHWPSYVFTEVTSRKWSFGGADFRGARQLTPVQVDQRPEPASEVPAPSQPAGPQMQPVLPNSSR